MRTRRSTKFLLGMLVMSLGLWAISRFYMTELSVPISENRLITIVNSDGVLYMVWDSADHVWWVRHRTLNPAWQTSGPALFYVSSSELPDQNYSQTVIGIRWWLVSAVPLLLWLIITAWRRARGMRRDVAVAAADSSSSA